MEKPLILIVDDTPDNLDVLGGILGKNYKVKAALNGERALRIAQGTPRPDMILLDVIMPNMDGYEVCRRLKADSATAGIPVIFVTAKAMVEDERMGLELGAVDYITKPISPPIVELRVRTQLALYDQQRELERMVQERTRELMATIEQLRETTAAKERIESELIIAGQIQLAMLPKTNVTDPAERGYTLSALLQPALQVGGDLYDFFPLGSDRLCLVIGDVSGKGVPAALTMARVITLVRAISKINSTPVAILEAINTSLCHENYECHFVTLFCAILEVSSGILHYSSGGHDAPFLLSQGQCNPLELETGPALGIGADAEFPSYQVSLKSGDLLLLYTDGITEALNPQREMFTVERLQSLLTQHPPTDSIRLIRSVQHFYHNFLQGAPASDDLTLLALHYLPSSPYSSENKAVEWHVSINNELTELELVRQRLSKILLDASVPVTLIEDMQLVTEEILVNVIEYAFKGTAVQPNIAIFLKIVDGLLTLTFEDTGNPFNPLEEIAPPDLSLGDDVRASGGLGFFLVRELVDQIQYTYHNGKNELLIVRKIASSSAFRQPNLAHNIKL